MGLFLGVDAGATKSVWLVCDASERVLATGHAAGVQASEVGAHAAGESLTEICRTAARAVSAPVFDAAVFGVAGAGSRAMRASIAAGVGIAGLVGGPLTVVGDPEIAAAAAFADEPGLAVWSGTGSFAVAWSAEAQLTRRGGRGPLLGDDGGAYRLCVEVLRVVARAADGAGPRTGFESELLAALAIAGAPADTLRDLGRVVPGLAGHRVAALLPVVADGLENGSASAEVRAIVRHQFEVLAEHGFAAARAAGVDLEARDVTVGGGVFVGASVLRHQFDELWYARTGRRVVLCPRGAEVGAVRLAVATAGVRRRAVLSNLLSVDQRASFEA